MKFFRFLPVPKLPLQFACGAFAISLSCSPALSNPEHTPAAGDPADPAGRLGMLEDVAMLDRLQTDSQRFFELIESFNKVAYMLGVLKPFNESILVLLDQDLPVEDRWRRAMALAPEVKDGKVVPEGESGGNVELEAEIVRLRSEVDALRAELAILDEGPYIEELPLPEEILEVNHDTEDGWELDRGSIRYVQLPEPGADTEPAVWLASAGDGLRVGVAETVFMDGKRIRLAELRERPGGRIRLLFAVDGEPRTIDW